MNDNIPSLTRRNALKSVPATGAILPLGELAIGRAAGAEDTNDIRLGEFDDGLDGWTTTAGNSLKRIGEDKMPTAVRVGTYALGVEIDGDLHPLIENESRVTEADFVNHPYVLAQVLGYAEETDSDMVFTFRLHHTHAPEGGQDDGGRGQDGGKDVLVEESDEQTVAQLDPHTLRWDLSDLDEEILRTTNRLEIVWYLEEHPPEDGHRGRARGDFDYRGVVAVDDVRLTDEVGEGNTRANREKMLALNREHGMVVERTFEERTEDRERGTLVFSDGTEIAYTFEVLADDRFRYTIDEETFLLGGDGDE